MSDEIAVEFECEIKQVKSMVDHTSNITINVPEYSLDATMWFLKRIGAAIKIVAVEDNGSIQR